MRWEARRDPQRHHVSSYSPTDLPDPDGHPAPIPDKLFLDKDELIFNQKNRDITFRRKDLPKAATVLIPADALVAMPNGQYLYLNANMGPGQGIAMVEITEPDALDSQEVTQALARIEEQARRNRLIRIKAPSPDKNRLFPEYKRLEREDTLAAPTPKPPEPKTPSPGHALAQRPTTTELALPIQGVSRANRVRFKPVHSPIRSGSPSPVRASRSKSGKLLDCKG